MENKYLTFKALNARNKRKSLNLQEGGAKGLYRGFLPTICGMIPYAGFSFYSFEQLKYLCMKYAPNYFCDECSTNTGKIKVVVIFILI